MRDLCCRCIPFSLLLMHHCFRTQTKDKKKRSNSSKTVKSETEGERRGQQKQKKKIIKSKDCCCCFAGEGEKGCEESGYSVLHARCNLNRMMQSAFRCQKATHQPHLSSREYLLVSPVTACKAFLGKTRVKGCNRVLSFFSAEAVAR